MSGAERTELRERIATALIQTHTDRKKVWEDSIDDHVDAMADAVLSVLPGTDAEDAAAIRRVLAFVAIVRESVEEDEKGAFYFVPSAEELFDEVQKTVTDDDVARLARLGQG